MIWEKWKKSLGKDETQQSNFEDYHLVEPERKHLQGVLCILVYPVGNETKFVLTSLPNEDIEPVTKAEAISRKTKLIFLGMNMLSFPGGAVGENELPSQALLREIKEELSMDVDSQNLLKSGVEPYKVLQSTEGEGETIMLENGRLHSPANVIFPLKIPKSLLPTFDRNELGFRYGTYTFKVESFVYHLNNSDVDKLIKAMSGQGRKVVILSESEVLGLNRWEVRPSTLELMKRYLARKTNQQS